MPRPTLYSPTQALALLSEGLTVKQVAEELGCHRSTVYALLVMARAIERLSPRDITPVNLGVFAVCNHQERPIMPGQPYYCVECQQAGNDWQPGMKASPLPKDRKKYRKHAKLKGGK